MSSIVAARSVPIRSGRPTHKPSEAKTLERPDAAEHVSLMADHCCASKGAELEILARRREQRRVLHIVLAINAVMFVVEFGAGILAGSTALMADASDMLGDALVYGFSLYAIERTQPWKASAALLKSGIILSLAIGIAFNVYSKITSGIPPSSSLMLVFGGLALLANIACLRMLWRFRRQDVNMSSTFECSRNDVISNIGVLVAAAAVFAFDSPWPDILIGTAMALLFVRSAFRVAMEAVPQLHSV